MPRVFVTQEVSNKNISPAEEYGELVVLLPPGEGPVIDTTPVIERLHDKLQDATVDDYLLLIGDPVGMAMSVAVMSDLVDGDFNMLKWDRQEKKYIAVHIDIYLV